jgi:glycosyltransferase involved in cell wall biosynthesis
MLWWRFADSAARTLPCDASIVVAFENCALPVFQSVRQSGARAVCILECPAVHYNSQTYGPLTAFGRWFVKKINSRKQREIDLAGAIIVLSQFARRTFIDAGVAPEKLHVVHLGVDTEFFAPRPMPEVITGIRFLFVGTPTYWKGVDVLGRAFSKLGKATLEFAGAPTPLARSIAASNSNITLLGHLTKHQLREAYARCHVLILPSRFDGFGMVVTEAMSTGRPVIVTEHVGAADLVVTDGPAKCGWVVKANDEASLLSAMNEAAVSQLHDLGAAARAQAETHSWHQYAQSVGQIYFQGLGDD